MTVKHTIELTNNEAYFIKHFFGMTSKSTAQDVIKLRLETGLTNYDILMDLAGNKNSFDGFDVIFDVYRKLAKLDIDIPKATVKVKKYKVLYKNKIQYFSTDCYYESKEDWQQDESFNPILTFVELILDSEVEV